MGDTAQGAPITVARDLTAGDLAAALAAGWRDFLACPAFGIFFAGIYVAGGLLLYFALYRHGQVVWLVPAAGGFPIIAPFVAVGLYEVSRRREAGLARSWGAVLGAVRGRGDDQVLMLGGFLFVGVTFWIIIAHGIFAVFLAESGIGTESLALFATPTGMAMLAVGGAVGAAIAALFYAVTVISLPLLIDREVDFLTAMMVSLAAVRANPVVMLGWGALIAAVLALAMVPLFLGLFVALPVLGHATWHLYRRAVAR
ncbi:DUF2189 domain-containing protein [Novosphingobium bradum]|uniref:DUF2189 domain-containing protein n=1 Tax=Novosphingobium bradum TaxID=1737444 RepID=A0ABV7IS99_9SPHN